MRANGAPPVPTNSDMPLEGSTRHKAIASDTRADPSRSIAGHRKPSRKQSLRSDQAHVEPPQSAARSSLARKADTWDSSLCAQCIAKEADAAVASAVRDGRKGEATIE
ncbi:hypothetical protein GGI22_007684, partial [Coemansia erecta]